MRLLWIPDEAAAAASAADLLDAAEVRRLAAFQDPAARERYLTSHVGLRVLLGAHLGTAPGDVELTRDPCAMPDCGRPHGRPAVAGRPDLRFSLAHAGDAALYALSGSPVGADVESARIAGDGLERVAPRLHPAERAALAALPADRRGDALLGCWVRKEALLKGLGTGLAAGLGAHHVGLADRLAPPGAPPPPEGWTLLDVPAPDGYQAAVAVRTTGTPAVLRLDRLRLA